MTLEQLIQDSAKYVKKYAPKYDIKVVSPIIAQLILESDKGTSELSINANNYLGLKYKAGRCPTAIGIYYKIGSEQNTDGTYTSYTMQWCKFADLENCIIGYFDFISDSRYANLKGVTDTRTYLERIKSDGYATSLNYVDNVYHVIQTYNLTRFDNVKEEDNMTNPIIALDAGHGLYTSGKRCLVSIDPNQTREWFLNDRIVDKIEKRLQSYNCTVLRVNDTTGKVDTPRATRVRTANQANADIYISMHHNAGIEGGSGGGTVVFYYPTGTCKADATKLYNEIIKCTGLRGNRSIPIANGSHLEVINSTHMPCFLIENGFMDSTTDTPIILTEEHAEKTAIAVTNFLKDYLNLTLKTGATAPSTNVSSNTTSNNTSTSTTPKVNITYAVKVEGGKVLTAVKNLDDYAGIENKKIIGLAMKVDKGTIKYQVHEVGGDWLPYVTGYNWNDHNNGYAGNSKPIDAVRVYYNTPSDLVVNGGYREAKYRVSPVGSVTYYDWQLDDTVNKAKGMDGYAGAFGRAIDKFQICIE